MKLNTETILLMAASFIAGSFIGPQILFTLGLGAGYTSAKVLQR